MRSWLRMVGLKVWFHTYGDALYSLRTGEPAFARTVGTGLFDYLATHPEEGEIFNSAMSDFGQGVAAAVLQGYDFSDVDTVVDVGGGNGSFISSILRANPRMTGILFDMPHVAEGARKSIADAGLAKRCDIAGGDFFMSIPARRCLCPPMDHPRLGPRPSFDNLTKLPPGDAKYSPPTSCRNCYSCWRRAAPGQAGRFRHADSAGRPRAYRGRIRPATGRGWLPLEEDRSHRLTNERC